MSVTRSEFFADANVNAALDRYADIVLDHVEARGPDSELPDPKAYLEEQGIRDFPDGPIEVHRTVGQQEHVMRPLCPDGSDGCVPKCRMVHGEWQCVWVCRCP
jgi:hypothetical protein